MSFTPPRVRGEHGTRTRRRTWSKSRSATNWNHWPTIRALRLHNHTVDCYDKLKLLPLSRDPKIYTLGPDFSNLLRANCETPRLTYRYAMHHIDPTMIVSQATQVDDAPSDPVVPIILDTGASNGLTMSEDDFVELVYGNYGSMSTAASDNRFPIIGTGIVGYDAIHEDGTVRRWVYPANLCKAAGTRLCSPQINAAYLRQDQRFPTFVSNQSFASIMIDKESERRITVPIDYSSNLPIVRVKHIKQQTQATAQHRPVDCCCGFNQWCRCPLETTSVTTKQLTLHQFLAEHDENPLDETNRNLSRPQKQLLLDHQRLGHIHMRRIQRLYRDNSNSDPSDETLSCLPSTFKSSGSCDAPQCLACLYAKARRRPTQSKANVPHSQAGHLTPTDRKLSLGELVSMDHFESTVRGRLWHTRGRERPEHHFVGGTIFFDHGSKAIFCYPQVSLGSSDTINSKNQFKVSLHQAGRQVTRYHSDNGVFTSDAFQESLKTNRNTFPSPLSTLSGVGAHHANAGAERAIQTVTYMAQAMMIHCHIRWPSAFSPSLWPMALEYATWIYNHIPQEDNDMCPMEVFSGTKIDCTLLRRVRVWGCPSNVLDPKLQDGKKLPKWARRSRRGQFLGFSPQHSSLVGMIRNLDTGHISPQFHVVYDELFMSVSSTWSFPQDNSLPDFFTRDHYLDDHDPTRDGPLPDLDSVWSLPKVSFDDTSSLPVPKVPEGEHAEHPSHDQSATPGTPLDLGRNHRRTTLESHPNVTPIQLDDIDPLSPLAETDETDSFDSTSDDMPLTPCSKPGESSPSSKSGESLPSSKSGESLPSSKSGESLPSSKSGESSPSPASDAIHEPTTGRPHRQRRAPVRFPDNADSHQDSSWAHTSSTEQRFSMTAIYDDPTAFGHYANSIKWDFPTGFDPNKLTSTFDSRLLAQIQSPLGIIDDWHPLYFSAKAVNEDAPLYFDIRLLPQEEQDKWIAAMDKELNELEDKKTFKLVPRIQAKGKEIVDVMWTFVRKRKPDGTISRYKARLVVRGDQQKASFSRDDTFAPVIDWPTVRLLLNLSIQHKLHTVSIDFKNAFVQSDLPEPIYVNLPQGYGAGQSDKVLEVTKSLYGDCRAPRLWYDYLRNKLEQIGLKPDGSDPCLFIGMGCVMITYVDDAVIYGHDEASVNRILEGLTQMKMDYEHLGDLPTYLGVEIKHHENGTVELRQPHLTRSIISALGLEKSNPKATPATKTIGKDLDGAPLNADYNYRSVVGMLLYLGNNTRPDCAFAINQTARFSNNPTALHGEALKRIGRYLMGTAERGLILKPSKVLSLHCYVDADFAGLWSNENPDDPTSVRSRTGFIITIGQSPITWSSKLQTEIALSTMEAEYIAASTSMRSLLPLRNQLAKIITHLHLNPAGPSFVCTVWEDNQAALQLATKDPPRMTPRSKHIGIKYHWFRAHINSPNSTDPNGIFMKAIATTDQLGRLHQTIGCRAIRNGP